jgi:hypothetical protein
LNATGEGGGEGREKEMRKRVREREEEGGRTDILCSQRWRRKMRSGEWQRKNRIERRDRTTNRR